MDLVSAALTALETGDFQGFEFALKNQQFPDAYTIVLSQQVSTILSNELGGNGVVDWIMRPRCWKVELYGPGANLTRSETLLHHLWQDLTFKLTQKLLAAFQEVAIAPQGAVLCFFGGTKLSVIVHYQQSFYRGVDLRPIVPVINPQGVFELPNLFADATAEQRNLIKAAAHSVDKLVLQRGALVHVDRLREDVFGPSIDTILLGETLAQWLETQPKKKQIRALEVGAGSGLLCTLLALSENVERTYAIDLNPRAVMCTLKNLKINGIELDGHRPRVSVRGERFDEKELPGGFNIIVCNPPYIPRPSTISSDKSGYDLAIGELLLCSDLLKALDPLLHPDGQLLLMTSSTSLGDIKQTVPAEFEIVPCLGGEGCRVPLDLDRLWQEPEWRQWLVKEKRVELDNAGGLWHYLQPCWVRRKGYKPS